VLLASAQDHHRQSLDKAVFVDEARRLHGRASTETAVATGLWIGAAASGVGAVLLFAW
jgi:hypothetical protein